MSFEVFWDPKAVSQLRKLPKDVSARIVKKVRLVSTTGTGLESLKEHEYGFRIRVGDYRVICDIFYEPDQMVIRLVGHRKKIYK